MKSEALPSHATCCKNCGAATCGNFCQQCGQATHLHVPSAREFLHEFIAHYVALEGKLWKSLALLLFKPGFLSREYIEGRRVRYIEPLRLYLTFSIIFFALFKMSGVDIVNFGNSGRDAARPAVSTLVGARQPKDAKVKEANDREEYNSFQRNTIEKLGSINPQLGANTKKFFDLPTEQQNTATKRAFFGYAPYAIFLLMPVFALFLKLLYLGTRRRYGEHFLFALHSNAFAFVMLSVFMLTPDGWSFVRLLTMGWLVFYLPTAMRRVYGGSRLVTGLRWIALMMLHMLSLIVAVVAATGMALMG
ncbi:DUF3667 domain-containing protein [Massilia niastensis]|uniref:DUF3667 domain-containing protein n=1 Tax=Massilia niastensis TaxID=544911 RepID=UPI00146B5EEF|nr:DUF3667 domain-containing protein [Massilia niastensis]